jgi:carbon-monoxide dehydrogenase small subunit
LEIKQSFTVARPLADVWALFQDIPTVARCMPGAELTEDKGNGLYAGKVGIKLGPFVAAFEGEAQSTVDAAAHSGHVEGRGIDKRGGSRSKLVMDYRLSEADRRTTVDLTADIQLSGPIAQFGRTGIITETATFLIGQFVQNVETRLAPVAEPAAPSAPAVAGNDPAAAAVTQVKPASMASSATGARPSQSSNAAPASSISAFTLLRVLIAGFFRRLFGRGA